MDILQYMVDYIENAMPRTRSLRLTGISNVLSADARETEVPTSIVFARLTDFTYMKDDKFAACGPAHAFEGCGSIRPTFAVGEQQSLIAATL